MLLPYHRVGRLSLRHCSAVGALWYLVHHILIWHHSAGHLYCSTTQVFIAVVVVVPYHPVPHSYYIRQAAACLTVHVGCRPSISRPLRPRLPISLGCCPLDFLSYWAATHLVAGCCLLTSDHYPLISGLPHAGLCPLGHHPSISRLVPPIDLIGLQPINWLALDCSIVVGRLLPAKPWPPPAHLHVGLIRNLSCGNCITEASMVYSMACGVVSTTVYSFC